MAINRNKDEKKSIPTRLGEMLLKAFTLQSVIDVYDEAYKASRGDVVKYLESNTDGFEIGMGKGESVECEHGKFGYQQRSNWSYDKDRIIELVKSGALSVETLVNLASFPAEKLKTAIGEKEFNALATNKPTESLVLTATSEFKEGVREKFDGLVSVTVPTEEKAVKKAEKPKAEPKKKASKKSAEDDLDAILKGVK